MRLFRALVPAACLLVLFGYRYPAATQPRIQPRAVRGYQDVIWAMPGDLNYSYGPRGRQLSRLTSRLAGGTPTFSVEYNGFTPEAQAAFQAAVSIWEGTITASVPIRVRATFTPLDAGVLGRAGPTVLCDGPVANTFYAAALSDNLQGSASCAALGGETAEIDAEFNSAFSAWDFSTSGTGAAGKYNFMTVVLHEIGHGLGFFGLMTSNGGVGSFDTPPHIYDRFAVTGSGVPLLNFTSPSAQLHAQLISNNTFFDGPNTRSSNSGQRAKLETSNFGTFPPADNGFLRGSSYSHIDDILYSGTPNGLMTYALNSNEVYTDPGPITRGIFKDEGWTVAGACTFTISSTSATIGPAGGTGTVTLTTQPDCAWTASSNNTAIATVSPTSGTGSRTLTYTVNANSAVSQRTVFLTIGTQSLQIVQHGTGPIASLDKTSVRFGLSKSGATVVSKTGAQAVRLTFVGSGPVSWTATPAQSWIAVSPASGSGSATLTIDIANVSNLPVGASITGSVAISFTGAGNVVDPIDVALTLFQSGTTPGPFGVIDTPLQNTTGITGAVPFTGWVLDETGVSNVAICRAPVSGERAPIDPRCGSGTQIFVGNATFIDGARPDVQAVHPTAPLASRGGWGFMVLTNLLPNLGNGTYTFFIYATDIEGHVTSLGPRTISCANATATAPFGAIDTPAQGEIITTTSYNNFGWVLARGPAKAAPPDGGIVNVVVDGVNVGSPTGWVRRSDLDAVFPATTYPGINHALGVFNLNTGSLSNGVHQIAWGVVDNTGHATGVGSRYFTVSNGSIVALPDAQRSVTSRTLAAPLMMDRPGQQALAVAAARPLSLRDEINAARLDARPIDGRRGYGFDDPLRRYPADNVGRIIVEGEELDRFELQLGAGQNYTAYTRIGDELGPLPIGSHLDGETGVFTWQPGTGFVGQYNLVFVRWGDGVARSRQEVRFILYPKGSNRLGPQVVIDLPRWYQNVTRPFIVAGWAADLDSWRGTGIDAIHIWAYPLAGGDPIFLGAARYGGRRPDVGAVYGDRFQDSGYGLTVGNKLGPGSYMLAVFGWSALTGRFSDASTVIVNVR